MSQAPVLVLRDLEVGYGSGAAAFELRVPELGLHDGEVLAVLGPNGAGKSTLLRVMGGLLAPRNGEVTRAPGRDTALVFQHPVTLAGSVAYNAEVSLWARGVPRRERRERAAAALEEFGIAPLARRRAATLSGGELRRLVLARAFAIRPAVLLLDEPFDDLDPAGRELLSLDLQRAIRETGVAVAMVTHDLRQALLLADRVAVLVAGRLAQVAQRDTILREPASPEVAQLVGMANLLPGEVAGVSGGLVEVALEGGARLAAARAPLPIGARVWVGIRPENVVLAPAHGQDDARLGRAEVTRIVSDGVTASAWLAWQGLALRTHLLAGRGLGHTLKRGDPVRLAVRPEDVHLMPRESA